ncbi:hypothetical protein BDV06DRAFT_207535 [Aspergillus oleicola]
MSIPSWLLRWSRPSTLLPTRNIHHRTKGLKSPSPAQLPPLPQSPFQQAPVEPTSMSETASSPGSSLVANEMEGMTPVEHQENTKQQQKPLTEGMAKLIVDAPMKANPKGPLRSA